ncbi:hypothetical protein BC629DRAFT_1542371 [Irpex lacteus]|nr:hypothetical protein BC629DRAFT_1542371 [Irpex lacteus]
MLNPNCPLHRISDEERVWMIKFTTLLWSHKENPAVDIKFDVSEEGIIEMRAGPFRFVSEETLTSTDRSVSALSVAGMHAYIQSDCNEYISDKLPANFGALVNHVRTQFTIRALVLLFDSFEHLQHSMKDFVDVLGPATETIELVLAYEEGGHKAVGVDLVTLEPNGASPVASVPLRSTDLSFPGRFWTDLLSPTAFPSDWHLKSLAIIQRQLKTKKWTNVH